MNRRDAAKVLGALPLLAANAGALNALSQGREAALHPRIAEAIQALEVAEKYMREARHDFGGHRVKAFEATRVAKEQLRLCLAYREARGR